MISKSGTWGQRKQARSPTLLLLLLYPRGEANNSSRDRGERERTSVPVRSYRRRRKAVKFFFEKKKRRSDTFCALLPSPRPNSLSPPLRVPESDSDAALVSFSSGWASETSRALFSAERGGENPTLFLSVKSCKLRLR